MCVGGVGWGVCVEVYVLVGVGVSVWGVGATENFHLNRTGPLFNNVLKYF